MNAVRKRQLLFAFNIQAWVLRSVSGRREEYGYSTMIPNPIHPFDIDRPATAAATPRRYRARAPASTASSSPGPWTTQGWAVYIQQRAGAGVHCFCFRCTPRSSLLAGRRKLQPVRQPYGASASHRLQWVQEGENADMEEFAILWENRSWEMKVFANRCFQN